MVLGSFEVGQVIMIEAGAQFSWVGHPGATAIVGKNDFTRAGFLRTSPMLMILPGTELFMVIIGVNLLAEELLS